VHACSNCASAHIPACHAAAWRSAACETAAPPARSTAVCRKTGTRHRMRLRGTPGTQTPCSSGSTGSCNCLVACSPCTTCGSTSVATHMECQRQPAATALRKFAHRTRAVSQSPFSQ
jgi:hypothetical protein